MKKINILFNRKFSGIFLSKGQKILISYREESETFRLEGEMEYGKEEEVGEARKVYDSSWGERIGL